MLWVIIFEMLIQMIDHYFIVYKKLEHPFSLKFDPYDNSPVELTLYNYLGLFIYLFSLLMRKAQRC